MAEVHAAADTTATCTETVPSTTRKQVFELLTVQSLIHVLALFLACLVILAGLVVAVLVHNMPHHIGLTTHEPSHRTVRLGTLGTMEVPMSPTTTDSSRGVLVVVESKAALQQAADTVAILVHRHRCTLPIIVCHAGHEALEWDATTLSNGTALALLRSTPSVTFLDVHTAPQFEAVGGRGSPTMPMALFLAPFRHVVALRADALPLMDPVSLLDSEQYQRTGAVFFPDFHATGFSAMGDARLWLGLPPEGGKWEDWTAEGSVLAFDRIRHWDALHALAGLTLHHKRLYPHLEGSKDTYRLAMEMAGDSDFHREGFYAGTLVLRDCVAASLPGDAHSGQHILATVADSSAEALRHKRGLNTHLHYLNGDPFTVSQSSRLFNLPAVQHVLETHVMSNSSVQMAAMFDCLRREVLGYAPCSSQNHRWRSIFDFASIGRTLAVPRIAGGHACSTSARPGCRITDVQPQHLATLAMELVLLRWLATERVVGEEEVSMLQGRLTRPAGQ